MDAGGPKSAGYVLPTIFFQSPRIKLTIVASYWLVILLGLPLWWITTSIERLALPVDRVRSAANAAELRFPIHISINSASEESPNRHPSLPDLARRVGALLESEKGRDPEAWQGLDVHVTGASDSKDGGSNYRVVLHTDVSSVDDAFPSFWLSNRSLHLNGKVPDDDPSRLSVTLASALSNLLVPHSARRTIYSHERLIARYANNFRLAFSLLNEDASAGQSVLGWDIESAIAHYLSPVLSQLSGLYNFTIESQIQVHAPLAFEPQSLSSNGERHYVLGEEELKMFINSAEWTLASSVSNDPVLHFILFVPSALQRPLTVQTSTGKISDSFVVPQWGGVFILNPSVSSTSKKLQDQTGSRLSVTDLTDSFVAFRSQLLTLLGVLPLPRSIVNGPPAKSDQLSDWQLDALLRKRALENTRDSKEALSSIVKLVDQIKNMPVGQDVKGDVQGALDAIEQTYSSAPDSPQWTLQHSIRANTLSSRAFFNPGMLALLYFPAEHKYAVYIPLFAPISLPLVVAAIKEIRRWRKDRTTGRQKVD